MKQTILILLFSCCITSIFSQNDYLSDFKKKWKNAADYTIEIAELMPADKYDYQPTEDVRTFKEQMLHIVQNMTWLSRDYLDHGKYEQDLKSTEYSKEEVIKILKEGFDFASKAVDNLEPHQLRTTVEFFAGPMHIRQILNLMNDHVSHHRGQALVYLRLNGVKPPRYRGW